MNYIEANDLLTGRCKESRKLENNTYLIRIDDKTIGVKLHNTFVVTFHKSDKIELNSGGWLTPTTKERINTYSPARIFQDKGVWYIGDQEFKDNCYYFKGILRGCKNKAESERQKKLKDKVVKYCNKYTDLLFSDKLDVSSGGDCWICLFDPESTEHLLSHIKENYFVPAIAKHLLDNHNGILSRIAINDTAAHLFKTPEHLSYLDQDHSKTAFKRAIKKYFGRNLNIIFK